MRQSYRLLSSSVLILALLTTFAVQARVKETTLSKLVGCSDRIVLATVVRISPKQTVAELKVLETWKGAETNRFFISYAQTQICDISTAVMGETAVFFLTTDSKSGKQEIAYSGRGRAPVCIANGKEYISFFPDVHFPDGLEIRSPKPKDTFYRYSELSAFKSTILHILKEEKGKQVNASH